MRRRLLAWALRQREGPRVIVEWADSEVRECDTYIAQLTVRGDFVNRAAAELERGERLKIRNVNWRRWQWWDGVVVLLGGVPDFPGGGV